uniref:Uncharacterized protein n=1 Tax=Daphnia magna TaxID=35525 RepID=A0A0P5WHN1_9CRUS
MAVVSNYDCQLHGYKCWQPTPIMSGRNVVFTLAFPHSVKTVFIFRARSYYTCRRLAQRSRKRVSKTSHSSFLLFNVGEDEPGQKRGISLDVRNQ